MPKGFSEKGEKLEVNELSGLALFAKYKTRLDRLAPSEKSIIEFLCEGVAFSLQEIISATNLAEGTVNSKVGFLKRLGYIKRLPKTSSTPAKLIIQDKYKGVCFIES